MSAFTWLNNLMEWFGRWFPRLTLIRSTHRGVLFLPGGRVKELCPGLWWYWPITSELQKISMQDRATLTSAQVVGHCRLVAVSVVWRVKDAKAVATRYRQFEARVTNEARVQVNRQGVDMQAVAQSMADVFAEEIDILDVGPASDGFGIGLKNFDDSAVRDWASVE